MSETTNLKLFKHDNPSTNTNPFDVEQSLNDNWDKIDTAAGEIQEEQTKQNEDIESLKAENANLKGEAAEEPAEPEPADEYPEFKEPQGSHDAYNIGDKITYNGKKYICQMNGCVWNPITYPQGWQEIIEENTEESEVNK